MNVVSVKRGQRKIRTGRVVRANSQKTITVEVGRLVRHPLYGRTIRRRTRFMVHDDENTAHVGDLVRIMETRPLSKMKRWRLIDIIERSVL